MARTRVQPHTHRSLLLGQLQWRQHNLSAAWVRVRPTSGKTQYNQRVAYYNPVQRCAGSRVRCTCYSSTRMEWVLSTHGSKMAAGDACSYLAGKPFFSGIKLAAALENGHDSTHNMQPGARRTACHAVHSMQPTWHVAAAATAICTRTSSTRICSGSSRARHPRPYLPAVPCSTCSTPQYRAECAVP